MTGFLGSLTPIVGCRCFKRRRRNFDALFSIHGMGARTYATLFGGALRIVIVCQRRGDFVRGEHQRLYRFLYHVGAGPVLRAAASGHGAAAVDHIPPWRRRGRQRQQAQVTGQNINNLLTAAKRREPSLRAADADWLDEQQRVRSRDGEDRPSLADLNVDQSRLYATGLSLGGGGTWNLINRHSDRFAASVPICAVGPTGDLPCESRQGADVDVSCEERHDGFVHGDAQRNRQYTRDDRRSAAPTRKPADRLSLREHHARPALHGVSHGRTCDLAASLRHACPLRLDVRPCARAGAREFWTHDRCGAGDCDLPPVSSETTTATRNPSGIVTMPGWLNGTSALGRSRP